MKNCFVTGVISVVFSPSFSMRSSESRYISCSLSCAEKMILYEVQFLNMSVFLCSDPCHVHEHSESDFNIGELQISSCQKLVCCMMQGKLSHLPRTTQHLRWLRLFRRWEDALRRGNQRHTYDILGSQRWRTTAGRTLSKSPPPP